MINNELRERVAIALKVPLHEVTSKNALNEYESKKKAEDFGILMEKTKEKINKQGTTHSEKIQLLTLIPESWSQNAIVNYFMVTDYMVRAA